MLLLDMAMPRMPGLVALRELRASGPAVKTLLLPLTSVFDKLGVSNRAELASYATAQGLARVPPSDTPGPKE